MRDGRQRTVDGPEIDDDYGQLTDRAAALNHEPAPDDDDEHGTDNRDRADYYGEERLPPGDVDTGIHCPVAGGCVSSEFMRLPREALHQAHRAERFVQPLEQLRFELLDALLACRQRRGVVAQAEE